jgi:hypothetical protein
MRYLLRMIFLPPIDSDQPRPSSGQAVSFE